jgi:hypothetical protein
MSLSQRSTAGTVTRVSTVIWVLALPMILGFFALSNIQNEVEFRTLQTFFFLYLGSGMGILFAQAKELYKHSSFFTWVQAWEYYLLRQT